MITICEGVKNAGKSFLIESCELPIYKFPFIDYFRKGMGVTDTGEKNRDAYWLNAGADVAILTAVQAGLIDHCIFDRGPLSNMVLGIMQNRVSVGETYNHLKYLVENHLFNNMRIIVVNGANPRDRNKDDWEKLSTTVQNEWFNKYITFIKAFGSNQPNIIEFKNNFDTDSVTRFKELFK